MVESRWESAGIATKAGQRASARATSNRQACHWRYLPMLLGHCLQIHLCAQGYRSVIATRLRRRRRRRHCWPLGQRADQIDAAAPLEPGDAAGGGESPLHGTVASFGGGHGRVSAQGRVYEVSSYSASNLMHQGTGVKLQFQRFCTCSSWRALPRGRHEASSQSLQSLRLIITATQTISLHQQQHQQRSRMVHTRKNCRGDL